MKTSYILKHIIGSCVFFSVLFISAGKVDYWQGWVYVIIGLLMVLLNYTVLRIDDELLEERSKPGEGTKAWDKEILGLSFLATVAMYVVAGLDSGRYNWSPEFSWMMYGLGAVLTAAGQLIFLVAQKQNNFFSSTVRIQTNREHAVCDTGMYSVVRHPAYMGSVIQAIGFPIVMGSLWSMIPVTVLILLQLVRTAMEDATLKNELKGYTAYAAKTRYKIVPFVW